MNQTAKIVGVALLSLGIAFGSEALTLGRIRGAALIGQPLDVLVPVQMEAGEDAASLCFEAEVFHADTRQDARRVRVLIEAATEPRAANLRVVSSVPVDEPVVTLNLRTGCGQKTSRRYVLLADLPGEVLAPTVPLLVTGPALAKANAPSVAAVAAPSPAAPLTDAGGKAVRPARQTVRRVVDRKRPASNSVVASSTKAKPDEKSAIGRSVGQSRLKLDPLELLSDRVSNLDSYMTFAPPQDALLNSQKVQALEENVKALLALTAKNEVRLVDLQGRLRQAESERFSGALVYGLLAFALACLAAVAMLWRRQRSDRGDDDWWSGSIATPAPATSEINTSPSAEPQALRAEFSQGPLPEKHRFDQAPERVNRSKPPSGVDVNLTEMSDSDFDEFMPSGVTKDLAHQSLVPAKAIAPQAKPGHRFNSEPILDVRQRAEFFVSLGQTENAVRVLRKQISESDASNPSIYLDLLSLLHALGMKVDFQQLRQEFNRLFNGNIPEYALFKDEGRDLEAYPDVVSFISAVWPTPEALTLLETCIIQNPRDAQGQSFDLAAFRDLLMLHAVAWSIVFGADSEERVTHDDAASVGVSLKPNQGSRPSGRALDLDLSDLEDAGRGPNRGFAGVVDPSRPRAGSAGDEVRPG